MGRHQIHIWLSEHQYAWLRREADESDQTVSAVVRRLVNLHRTHLTRASSRDAIHLVSRTSPLHKE